MVSMVAESHLVTVTADPKDSGATDGAGPILRRCTPFCDRSKECPPHHELLVSIVNCTDQLGVLSNLGPFKACVARCVEQGWDKDDDIPDVNVDNRFPLIHWAAAMGKCHALEWMLYNGFSPKAKSAGAGESALHKAITSLHRSRPKFTVKDLVPKFSKVVVLLKDCLGLKDDANGDTPFHTAASMLVHETQKPMFFQNCIEVMVKQAVKANNPSEILDVVNDEGETVLHLLAQGKKSKIEYCCGAIKALIKGGADRAIQNNDGHTPLDIAIAQGTQPIVEELIKVYDPEEMYGDGGKDGADFSSLHPLHSEYPSTSMKDDETKSWTGDSDSMTPVKGAQSPTGSETRVKEEPNSEEEHSPGDEDCGSTSVEGLSGSPLLKHLGEAGLLHDVSLLIAKSRARDESQMKRLNNQCKDIDAQINFKLKEIDRLKMELGCLRAKRKHCEGECGNIEKRLKSCESAIKEIPKVRKSHER